LSLIGWLITDLDSLELIIIVVNTVNLSKMEFTF